MTARVQESEASFQDAVLELASLQGWERRYHTRDSRGSEAGFPDLVLMRPPELIVVELKARDNARATSAQRAWLDAFAACRVEAHLWRPSDWDEIKDRLARRHKKRGHSTRITDAAERRYRDAIATLRKRTDTSDAVHNGRADQQATQMREALGQYGVDLTDPDALRLLVAFLHEVADAVNAGAGAGPTIGRAMLCARVLTEDAA